jgi:hypothetical protein
MSETSQLDLSALINAMASEFERIYGVTIPPDARQVLIEPAIENRDAVYAELASGQLTVPMIRDKVMEQLDVAREVAQERNPQFVRESALGKKPFILLKDIVKSMNIRCALMFWC